MTNLQPSRRVFRSHFSNEFIEFVRGRIHKRCSEFPVFLYHVRQAELQLEEEARRVIVECLIEGFPEAWVTPRVTKDWPKALCQIKADHTEARLTPSWSPETDALQGGSPVEAIDFPVRQAPPNKATRMIRTILNAIPGKRVADPDLAPVGTPDGKPKRAAAKQPPAPNLNLKSTASPKPGVKSKPRP